MAHANLSFETPDGANAGLADAWVFAASSGAEAYAAYAGADGIDRTLETFAVGWDVESFATELAGTSATYSASIYEFPPSQEGFEAGWATDQALRTDVAPAAAADYSDGDGGFASTEGLEAGWGIDSFETSLGAVVALPVETFESGWDNDSFSLTLGATSAALFYEGSESVEGFEEFYAPRPFVAIPATDTLYSTLYSHELADGDVVELYSTGRLPGGLNPGAKYWVDDADAVGNTLKLDALAPGLGPAFVDITDAGVGTHFLVRSRSVCWTDILDLET